MYHMRLDICRPRQVFLRASGVVSDEVVVESFVVTVVKPLLDEGSFGIPVAFGNECVVRVLFSHRTRYLLPVGCRKWLTGQLPPGALDDVVKHQHCHVTADAVAHRRDTPESFYCCSSIAR